MLNTNIFEYEEMKSANDSLWSQLVSTRYAISNNGLIKNIETDTILKATENDKGYNAVSLHIDDFKVQTEIHRLVAEAFIMKPASIVKLTVDHKDCVKTNNHFKNLEWVSLRTNIQRSSMARGGGALTEANVIYAIESYLSGTNCTAIAKIFKVDGGTIRQIMRLNNWKDISMPYREQLLLRSAAERK